MINLHSCRGWDGQSSYHTWLTHRQTDRWRDGKRRHIKGQWKRETAGVSVCVCVLYVCVDEHTFKGDPRCANPPDFKHQHKDAYSMYSCTHSCKPASTHTLAEVNTRTVIRKLHLSPCLCVYVHVCVWVCWCLCVSCKSRTDKSAVLRGCSVGLPVLTRSQQHSWAGSLWIQPLCRGDCSQRRPGKTENSGLYIYFYGLQDYGHYFSMRIKVMWLD